jgi:hypothetical protein
LNSASPFIISDGPFETICAYKKLDRFAIIELDGFIAKLHQASLMAAQGRLGGNWGYAAIPNSLVRKRA